MGAAYLKGPAVVLHPAKSEHEPGCTGKLRHKTAEAARKSTRNEAAQGRGNLHHYRCKACGGWHVSSLTKAERQELGRT